MRNTQKVKRILIPALILIILILITLWQQKLKASAEAEQARKDAKQFAVHQELDALNQLQSIRDSIALLRARDSILRIEILEEQKRQDSIRQAQLDEIARKKKAAGRKAQTLQPKNTQRDSIPPELTIHPTTGIYYTPIIITATCSEPKCFVFSSTSNQPFAPFSPDTVQQNRSYQFFARDSAGNHSDTLLRTYEFAKATQECPDDMAPVPHDDKRFCMDIYEWPNIKNEYPTVFVSHQKAKQLCESKGKRLCTKDEWVSACTGKYNTSYPYGDTYQTNGCVSSREKAERAGKATQCRSFHGLHDMSGNVWEWTDTPHETRSNYYYVSGGNWAGKDATKCSEAKYSFFPQNQYQFVGFRCCK